MTIVNLYRYIDENGTTVTPNRRAETDPPYKVRLIADDGKDILKDGVRVPCIDTDSAVGWTEVPSIDPTEDDPTSADYEAALAELGVE